MGAQALSNHHPRYHLPGALDVTLPHHVYRYRSVGAGIPSMCCYSDKPVLTQYYFLFQYAPPLSFSRRLDDTNSCDVTLLAMGFDLIILIFTAVALLGRHSARTDLWKLLFQDGLVYFLVSFSTNCIPAVCPFHSIL